MMWRKKRKNEIKTKRDIPTLPENFAFCHLTWRGEENEKRKCMELTR